MVEPVEFASNLRAAQRVAAMMRKGGDRK